MDAQLGVDSAQYNATSNWLKPDSSSAWTSAELSVFVVKSLGIPKTVFIVFAKALAKLWNALT